MTLSQDTRNIRLSAPGHLGAELVFRRLSAFERMSALFEYRLHALCEKPDLKLGKALGEPFLIELVGEQGPVRFFHGLCTEARFVGAEAAGGIYEFVLRPAAWFKSRAVNFAVHHHKTADKLISEALEKDAKPFVQTRMHFFDPPLEREYCVQYGESDFHFASRLMEQEGIHYFFEASQEGHVMAISNIGKGADRPMSDFLGEITYFPPGSTGHRPTIHIDEWSRRESVEAADGVASTDYNLDDRRILESSGVSLVSDRSGGDAPYETAEVTRFPGRTRDLDQLKRHMEFAGDAEVAMRSVRHASGNALLLTPGKTFDLVGHPDEDQNRRYLIVETRHYIDGDAFHSSIAAAPPRIDIIAIPDDAFFRPRQSTPRPRVIGPQTAIVAGDDEDATEEIAVDHLGRVRVNFMWTLDTNHLGTIQHGKHEQTSCWIRVAQIWAGIKWGALFTPRVGQEVVVEFEDGDPDRPLITGSVYNGKYPPPYPLPGEKTKSTIKSESSKGGKGFNEMRFEDKKGQEELYLHAQKDMNVRVLNHRDTTIGEAETRTIQESRTTTLKKGDDDRILEEGSVLDWLDEGDVATVIVEGGRETEMKRDDNLTIEEGNQSIQIKMGKQETSAMVSIELSVGPSSIKLTQGSIEIKAPLITIEGATTQIKGSGVLTLDGGVIKATGGVVNIN